MKEFLKNIKTKACKAIAPALAVVASALATVSPAFAASLPGADVNPEELVIKILGVVATLGRLVGCVLLAVGVYQFILAFKDDNADAKTRGVTLVIVGALLIGMKWLLALVGINLG